MNVPYLLDGRGARPVAVVSEVRKATDPPSASDRTPPGLPRVGQVAAEIAARAEEVVGARRQLGALLRLSGLSEYAFTAELAAQELLANAMVHGCGNNPALRISVKATLGRECLRVEVEDPSVQRPCPRVSSADDEDGRGLSLVKALVTRWGTFSSSSGKTVWFELDLADGNATP